MKPRRRFRFVRPWRALVVVPSPPLRTEAERIAAGAVVEFFAALNSVQRGRFVTGRV